MTFTHVVLVVIREADGAQEVTGAVGFPDEEAAAAWTGRKPQSGHEYYIILNILEPYA
jgi:hypothetical protein